MSMIIGKALIAGGGTVDRLDFTYTGQYNERLEDGVVEFLTTGVLKFKKEVAIDAFLVGGGGGGGSGKYVSGNYSGGGGGGGGYTETLLNIVPRANTEYSIVIGTGGTSALKGGDTSAFGKVVNGGACGGIAPTGTAGGAGGNGGSGGGGGGRHGYKGANGGSDGDNGGSTSGAASDGSGQSTTTREFGEATGKLYAGGGGGGGGYLSGGTGGSGGGGNGASFEEGKAATGGTDNTGGGGGGSSTKINGAAGGSGIVCIRLHKEA